MFESDGPALSALTGDWNHAATRICHRAEPPTKSHQTTPKSPPPTPPLAANCAPSSVGDHPTAPAARVSNLLTEQTTPNRRRALSIRAPSPLILSVWPLNGHKSSNEISPYPLSHLQNPTPKTLSRDSYNRGREGKPSLLLTSPCHPQNVASPRPVPTAANPKGPSRPKAKLVPPRTPPATASPPRTSPPSPSA